MNNVLSNWLLVPKMPLCYLLTTAAGLTAPRWVHYLLHILNPCELILYFFPGALWWLRITAKVPFSYRYNIRCWEMRYVVDQSLELITTIARVIRNTEGSNSVLVKPSHESFLLWRKIILSNLAILIPKMLLDTVQITKKIGSVLSGLAAP